MRWRCKSIFLVIVLAILVQNACKKVSEKNSPGNNIPESFWSFYEKFHEDSLFQLDHIIFPLDGIPANDYAQDDNEQFHWDQEEWILHKPFKSMDGTFRREFSSINHIVIERITDQSGVFQMSRRFAYIQDDWNLIYYAAMRKIK